MLTITKRISGSWENRNQEKETQTTLSSLSIDIEKDLDSHSRFYYVNHIEVYFWFLSDICLFILLTLKG